jgi:folate-binding protein YgfZ
MNTQWQDFLATQGGTIDDTSRVRFANRLGADKGGEADPALCALGEYGIIGIQGADATSFLQGQLSNDLRELTPEHSQLSSHCNAKGRMVANFRVLREGDDSYQLLLPREQITALLPRLKMFVLRAQVSVTDLSDDILCLGLIGETLRPMLETCFGSVSDTDNALTRQDDSRLLRVAGAPARWLLLAPVAAAEKLWRQARDQGAQPADGDLWALHDIRAGIPVITAATRELFVPQMANMHLIDGVSFHKGCYTGQEVVARMQYLGKLKRRMYLGDIDSNQAPAPGSKLHAPGSQSEQGAGTILDARINAKGHCELLAVAETAAVERNDIRLADTDTPLHLRPPPYGLPT